MIDYKFESYALIASSIVIAGLLRIYLFFKSFNILVLPYIELEELTTLALDNILFFSIFIILNLIIITCFYKSNSERKKRFRRLKDYGFFKIDKVILIAVVSIILFYLQNYFQNVYFYEFILWIILLLIGVYMNPFIYFEVKQILRKEKVKFNKLTILLIISAINLSFFAGISGISEAHKVKSENYYNDSEFELDDGSKIISNPKKYYIGKTKEFIFFYQPNEEITQIIPVSRIINIEMKKNKPTPTLLHL